MKKFENKIKKCYNIVKKIKCCLNCHKIIKNKIKNIIKKNLKKNYKELLKFKYKTKYNLNMHTLVSNVKNKYLIEICKYLKKILNIKKILKIN